MKDDRVSTTIPPKFSVLLIIGLVLILLLTAVALPFAQPLEDTTDQYYIDNSQIETGSNNVVTAVVFDYRGFDTLGEAAVLFIAVLGIAMMFRRRV